MHAAGGGALAESNGEPDREVILVAVADEEAGGASGAQWLIAEHAGSLGFGDRPAPDVLGEGGYGLSGVLDRPVMPVVLGEKTAVWMNLVADGDPGHGAIPPQRQAPAGLASAIDRVSGYTNARVHPVMRAQFGTLAGTTKGPRRALFKTLASPAGSAVVRAMAGRLAGLAAIGASLADTVTPTQLDAGYKHNVVPGRATAALDCRLLPGTDPEDFIRRLEKRVGPDIRIEVPRTFSSGPVTEAGDIYEAIVRVTSEFFPEAITTQSLTPAITDVRFFRSAGARGYGWAPLILEPELLATIHGHDERIPTEGFERAVAAMTGLIRRVAGR
jgi:acetylornithine deacetylase/succinyl-diaminopimelate desuccinylase-like protein